MPKPKPKPKPEPKPKPKPKPEPKPKPKPKPNQVPIPQYPLYSAALALAKAHLLPYELDEDAGWSLPIAQLEASLAEARAPNPNPSQAAQP